MRDDIDHLDSYNATFRDGTKPEADDFEPVENIARISMGASCRLMPWRPRPVIRTISHPPLSILGKSPGHSKPQIQGRRGGEFTTSSFKTILITSIYSAVRVQILKGQLRIYCRLTRTAEDYGAALHFTAIFDGIVS